MPIQLFKYMHGYLVTPHSHRKRTCLPVDFFTIYCVSSGRDSLVRLGRALKYLTCQIIKTRVYQHLCLCSVLHTTSCIKRNCLFSHISHIHRCLVDMHSQIILKIEAVCIFISTFHGFNDRK